MEKTTHSDPESRPLDNPMATASLVLGIASVVLLLIPVIIFVRGQPWQFDEAGRFLMFPWFLFAGILAIVFGHPALRKIGRIFQPVKGKLRARVGLALGYLMACVLPALSLAIPTFSKVAERSNETKAISNCRQIITTLRLYASDNGGKYPDGVDSKVRTSNDAFRLMFAGGEADNELIFGAPLSPYQPDGNIGKSPDYLEVLKPSENHWAMTRGLNDSVSGTYPLIFENPAEASWPPKWNANFVAVAKPGRVWKGGKIVIGMNDSSVALQSLESDKGDRVGLMPLSSKNKVDVFSQNDPAKDGLKVGVLDVAR